MPPYAASAACATGEVALHVTDRLYNTVITALAAQMYMQLLSLNLVCVGLGVDVYVMLVLLRGTDSSDWSFSSRRPARQRRHCLPLRGQGAQVCFLLSLLPRDS